MNEDADIDDGSCSGACACSLRVVFVKVPLSVLIILILAFNLALLVGILIAGQPFVSLCARPIFEAYIAINMALGTCLG
jgi:hypothetical protein